MKNARVLIICLFLAILLISPVMAATTYTYTGYAVNSQGVHKVKSLEFFDISNLTHPYTLSDTSGYWSTSAYHGVKQTPVTFNISGTVVGTGNIGYINSTGGAITSVFVTFNEDWDASAFTGNQYVFMDYDWSAVDNLQCTRSDDEVYTTVEGPVRFVTESTDFGRKVKASTFTTAKTYTFVSDVPYQTADMTINVKSISSGLNIPRADVTLNVDTFFHLSSETDLEGNITFTGFSGVYSPKIIEVSKAGYNTSTTSVVLNNSHMFVQIYLYDYVGPAGTATVFLDIADLADGSGITDATVGIQNTTADVNQWYYNTYAESTIPFNKTGTPPGVNLSVGQVVVFSGYKTGTYEANNTGSYTIPSATSHLTLYLKKVTGNTSASYQYPVNVVDSTTGYTISGSYLNVTTLLDTDGGYNSTSASGKFNVTGHGTNMHVPLIVGDVLVLTGYAPGYNTWYVMTTVSDSTNGVLQNVPLDPSGIQPLVNESTLIFSVYDAQTSQALSNVAVKIGSTTVATNSAGNAAFYNVTALKNTYTVSKSGYTTQTGIANAVLGQIVAINVGMSPSSVNPTVTVTTTPPFTNLPVTTAPNGSYSGFWAPIEHGFSAAGASSLEMGILMAGLLVIVGVIVGGFAAASVIPGAAFSTTGGLAGGVFGLLAAIAFGFIPLIYIIVLIFVLVFAAVMMRS